MENINIEKNEYNSPFIEEPAIEEVPAEEPLEVVDPVLEVEEILEPVAEPEAAVIAEEPVEIIQEVKTLGPVGNGAFGSTTTNQKSKPAKKKAEKDNIEKIAVHSTKNVSWQGVGKVYRGYNIVTKEQAEKWLTRSHIRSATPDEVAREFGQ